MADINTLYPSKYLASADLQGRTVAVVIDRIEIEEVGQRKERRPILYFQGKEKGMVLNKTNAKKITGMYGNDYDEWVGCEISLFSMMVEFQGESVPAIRVGVPMKKTKAASPVQAAPAPRRESENPAVGMDDEIPF